MGLLDIARGATDRIAVRVLNVFDYFWHGPTIAHMFERKTLSAEEVEELIERGFDYTSENDLGLTPADYAVICSDTQLSALLAERSCPPRIEFLCEQGEDHAFLELLSMSLRSTQLPSRQELGRALLRLCKNKKLTPSTLKTAIRELHIHGCNINFEDINPHGKRENVVVLLAEHWGLDMWREILKYPIRKDLIPLPYRYISGSLEHL